MLKKCYLGGFFGAPIPDKWHQNMSGFADALYDVDFQYACVKL